MATIYPSHPLCITLKERILHLHMFGSEFHINERIQLDMLNYICSIKHKSFELKTDKFYAHSISEIDHHVGCVQKSTIDD